MGIYDRDYNRPNYGGGRDFRFTLRPITSIVMYLLIINVAVFLLSAFIPPIGNMITKLFSVYPANMFLSLQVWRFITYQFLHGGIGHVFFNMLVLFFFGPMLEKQWGSKKFLTFYLICGASGGILYTLLVAARILPPGVLVGASGAIYGMLAAGAILYPNQKVYVFGIFPLPFMALAIILATISFLNFIGGDNAGGQAAHLAGMAAGAVYVLWGPWQAKTKQRSTHIKWQSKLNQERTMQANVDKILDKINKHGIGSLSRQEKKILKQASQKQQEQNKY